MLENWPKDYISTQKQEFLPLKRIHLLADSVRISTGHSPEDPIDLDVISMAGGFSINEDPKMKDTDALLAPRLGNKFNITVRQTDIPTSRYFTCHEIGHSFEYIRYPDELPYKQFRRPPNGLNFTSNYWVERFAEEFARRLLVPKEIAAQMNSINEIADHFMVPTELALLALNTRRPMITRDRKGRLNYAIKI